MKKDLIMLGFLSLMLFTPVTAHIDNPFIITAHIH